MVGAAVAIRHIFTENDRPYTAGEIDDHVAEFLRKGGKVQKLGTDATGYDRSGKQAETFVINHHILPRKTKKSKQHWKEYKHEDLS